MLILCFLFSQEMYPPKVHQFAYVTDEACTEDEILSMEIIIMKVNNTDTLCQYIHTLLMDPSTRQSYPINPNWSTFGRT